MENQWTVNYFESGKRIGYPMDTHIYLNQLVAIKEQIERTRKKLHSIETDQETSQSLSGYIPSQI